MRSVFIEKHGPEIEPGLRDKRAIVETFQVLGCRLGRGRVLWRYAPSLFSDAIGLAWHEARFRKLCKALSPFTDQVTVSFLDPYPGRPMGGLRPPNALEMQELAAMLAERTHSQVVQVIGKMIVLYKPAKEEKDRKIVLPQ